MKKDVHKQIVDQLVATIERGDKIPWVKPWDSGDASLIPVNAVTGNYYRGGNVISLWITAQVEGYTSNQWATYKQWLSMSTEDQPVHVRRKEKATMGVKYKPMERETKSASGETRKESWMLPLPFFVFNRDQVEGLPKLTETVRPLVERVESFDAMVRETGARIEHGGDRACFMPDQDKIRMPTIEQFQGRDGDSPTAAYYATLAHELTHWTGHKSRLDRTFGKRFGDQAYAVEELVAELGAAFALAEHGLGASTLRHAGYLQSWLDVIKEHPKALFMASSKASQAVDYLHGRVGAQKAEAA